jgi:LytS/YehU family sensor histidine kinase
MSETFYFSNKSRNENVKYLFVFLLAVITWILQLSIFSRILYFDSASNLMLLGSVFCGLIFGPLAGTIFGLISSFFCSSLLYDHLFYFSYPLMGFISGLLIKNIFSDELVFFILLAFILTFPFELFNGIQYNNKHLINVFDRYLPVSFYSSILNILIAPFFYWFSKLLIKRFRIKSL